MHLTGMQSTAPAYTQQLEGASQRNSVIAQKALHAYMYSHHIANTTMRLQTTKDTPATCSICAQRGAEQQ